MELRDDGPLGSATAVQRIRGFLAQALGLRELTFVGASLFVLLCFAIPFAHVLRLGPLLPNVIGFVIVLALARVPISQRAAFVMIGVCLAAYLTMELVVLANHWVEPVSDFRTQWEVAKSYVEHGLGVPDRPQTQRAIPFYYPMVKIFGTSPNVYLAWNVILHTLSATMAVWVARRFFGWPAAAKTALVLLFGFEPWLANTFPSHDVFGSFSILLFLMLLVEIDHRIEGETRPRLGLIAALAVLMSMTIAWADWQRGTGTFCSLGLVFYGIGAFVRRRPRWKLQAGLAVAVCVFSAIQGCGLKSAKLSADMEPNNLLSTEMGLLVFGSDEGDGRFGDWYRNARLAQTLTSDEVASISKFAAIDSLRENPRRKYRRYLERQQRFLMTGIDSAWYLKIDNPRWIDEAQLRGLWDWGMKWTRPIWWAIALLVGIAAIFRREVLFDVRAIPMIVVALFMAAMGMAGEAQSRYALFFVFVWPIYAGSPYLCNPLPGLRGKLGPPRRVAHGLARLTTTLVAVIAIPVILLMLASFASRPGLVDLHEVQVHYGASAEVPGAPPYWKVSRHTLVVADEVRIGSERTTIAFTTSGRAPHDDSTLRFVIYQELGRSIDLLPGVDTKETSEVVAGRALRVTVDGVLRQTIDLSRETLPKAFAIPGFAAGDHAISLELDLGASHRHRPDEKCIHRWTSPPNCFNTSIGYLGFF